MPYYRLYHIKQDRFAGVDDFEAEDDVQACRHAETLNGTATAELWCGKRKIRTFTPDAGLAAGAYDGRVRLSGQSGDIQGTVR